MNWNSGECYDISFSIHKSRRYNAKLRDFYHTVHSLMKVSIAFAASGAFLAILGSLPKTGALLAGFVAIASFLDMFLDAGNKAAIHGQNAAEFSKLAADLEQWEANPENLSKARARRIRIEAHEPHEKRLVDLMADNEEARSRGCLEAQLMPLSRMQRTFGFLFDFGLKRIEIWKQNLE